MTDGIGTPTDAVSMDGRLLSVASELAGIGVWTADAHSGELTVSRYVYELHGLSPEQYPAHPRALLGMYGEEDAKALQAAAVACMREGTPYTFEFALATPAGQQRHLRLAGRAQRAEDGTIIGIEGIYQDITEMKRREADQIRAREEAQEALRFKSQFLANMSHEIRTPLNGMIGTLTLANDMELSDDAQELVDIAQHSAENLLVIVNDILDLAKIESGNMTFERVPVDLRQLAAEVARTFRGQASSKGVEVLIRVADATPKQVVGDPTRIRQVLSNLVGNAVKFTDDGEVVIGIAPGRDEQVIFAVQDSGVGISEDMQQQIFDAFRQADGTITRKFGGTGLGLAICKELVARLGGKISVKSAEGRGSTFTFDLTLPPAATSTSTQAAVEDDDFVVAGLQILLAEDNDINAMVAQRTLAKMGHDVTRVSDGAQALKAVLEHAFDLVLMDLQMPNLDGLQATRLIRSSEPKLRRRTPIVALSANAFESDIAECLEAGMDAHLAKPLRRNLLAEVIERFGAVARTPDDLGLARAA